jgi:hypothetical protein
MKQSWPSFMSGSSTVQGGGKWRGGVARAGPEALTERCDRVTECKQT